MYICTYTSIHTHRVERVSHLKFAKYESDAVERISRPRVYVRRYFLPTVSPHNDITDDNYRTNPVIISHTWLPQFVHSPAVFHYLQCNKGQLYFLCTLTNRVANVGRHAYKTRESIHIFIFLCFTSRMLFDINLIMIKTKGILFHFSNIRKENL